MAAAGYKVTDAATRRKIFTVCTFCNSSTNGFEKKLFTTPQPKGPFFPILAEMETGVNGDPDELGRTIVCVACFHHLLRQWSSYERRCIPLAKRCYKLITDDRVNNFQHKREDEIRKEAELRLKEIQHREEKIRQEAEEKLRRYREREEEIKQEAELRLRQEHKEQEEIKKQTERKLREELKREEEIKRELAEQILEQKEKADYIRREAERLLREEKLSRKTLSKTNLNSLQETRLLTAYSEGELHENQRASSVPDLQQYNSESVPDSVAGDMESRTIVTQTVHGIRLRRSGEDEDSAEARRRRRRERSRSREEKENVQYQKVEYKLTLKADEAHGLASAAEPDGAGKKEESGEPVAVTSELKFVVNGQEEREPEIDKPGCEKKDDLNEEDIRKAGEEMRAKFEEERKRFQKAPEESASTNAEERAARRKRDIGRKRAQFLFRGPSDTPKPAKTEPTPAPRYQPRPSTEPKAAVTKTSESKSVDRYSSDPKKADPIPAPRNQSSKLEQQPEKTAKYGVGGKHFPEEDEEAKRRRKNREERNRRRREGEGVSLRRPSDPDETPTDSQVRPRARENLRRLSQPEASSEQVESPDPGKMLIDEDATKPVEQEKQQAEVSLLIGEDAVKPVEQEKQQAEISLLINEDAIKPVEQEKEQAKISLINEDSIKPVEQEKQQTEVSLIDEDAFKPVEQGKQQTEVSSLVDELPREEPEASEVRCHAPYRKRADSTEGEAFPKLRDHLVGMKTAAIQLDSDEVDSAQVFTLENEAEKTTATEEIEPAVPQQRGARVEYETIEEERKRKKKEMEEKRRRIEERQRKVAEEKRRQERGETSPQASEKADVPEETEGDRSERRKSLLLMWESMSDLQPPSPRTPDPEDEPVETFTDVLASRKDNSLKREYKVHNLEDEVPTGQQTMEVKSQPKRQRFGGKGSDIPDERPRWDRTGQTQRGGINGNLIQDFDQRPSEREKLVAVSLHKSHGVVQNGFSSQREDKGKPFEDFKPKELLQEPSYEEAGSVNEVESAPEPLWRTEDGYGMESDEDEPQRKPFYELDEQHHMTKDEEKWESAGHFQPGKLDTSKFNRFARNDDGNAGKGSIKKGDSSRYDVLKKMHQTPSKTEILVPSKLKLNAHDGEAIEENDTEPESRRPYLVDKLDETLTVQFQKGNSPSGDDQKHRLEDERRRREREEIERAREEEERRQCKDEQEQTTEKGDIYSDEVDKKVKRRSFGGKVDVSLWQGFCAEEDLKQQEKIHKRKIKETELPSVVAETTAKNQPYAVSLEHYEDEFDRKVKEKKVGKLSLNQSPFTVVESREDASIAPKQPMEDVVEHRRAPEPVESMPVELPPEEEDEYEVKIKHKAINKLDRSRFALQQTPDDVRRKQLEEERYRREQEEMELLKQEERRRREFYDTLEEQSPGVNATNNGTYQTATQKENDQFDDEIDRKVKQKNVGRLTLNESPFKVAGRQKESLVSPKQKASPNRDVIVPKQQPIEDVVEVRRAPEPVESVPVELPPEEENEYEIKIKQRAINKLDRSRFALQQTPDDVRRRQLEEERYKREQEELELLKQEEQRRQSLYENEEDKTAIDSDEDEFDCKVKHKKVGKLSLDGSPFTAVYNQKEMPVDIKPKAQPRSVKLIVEEKQQPMEDVVKVRRAPEPVESVSAELPPEEEDEYEVKIKHKAVNKLDRSRFALQQTSDDVRRKQVEGERYRREQEELELLKQEEQRRQSLYENEEDKTVIDSDEDDFDRRVKHKKVGKLTLEGSPFTAVENQKEVPVDIKPQAQSRSVKLIVEEKQQPMEDVVEVRRAPEPVESVPAELPPEEEDEYEIKIKQRAINKLDRSRFALQQTPDDVRRRQLEEERYRREQEELELLKQEEQRRQSLYENEEDKAVFDSDEDEFDRRVKHKKVGKLTLEGSLFTAVENQKEVPVDTKPQAQSRSVKLIVEEKQQPIEDVVKVRRAPEPVESVPVELPPEEEDEYEIKIKQRAINKLDRSRFALQQTPDDVRRRQLEEERYRREQEELELLKQEEQRRQSYENEEDKAVFDSDEDEFDRRVKHKKVGKLTLEGSPFTAVENQKEVPVDIKPQAQSRSVKLIVEEKQQPMEDVVKVRHAPEPVESVPDELPPEEEDEYEVKIKQKAINKLDRSRFSLQQTPDDVRRRQLEEERYRREQEELELLKQEEQRRQSYENEEDKTAIDSDEDEFDRRVKHKKVGKLTLDGSPFTAVENQKEIPVEIKPKTQPRNIKLIVEGKQQPAEGVVEVRRAPEPVESVPDELPPEEEDEYEIKIKQKAIGKLDRSRFALQQTPDDVRPRHLEEERHRREQEEMELLKQKEQKRRKLHDNLTEQKEETETSKDVRKKLDRAMFEQSQRRDSKDDETRRQLEAERWLQEQAEMEFLREEERRRSQIEENDVCETLTVDDTDKPKSVGKLNQKLMNPFQKQSDIQTEMTGKVVFEEKSKRKSTSGVVDVQLQSETSAMAEASPSSDFRLSSEKQNSEEKRKVGKLNVNWMSVASEESAERDRRRTQQLGDERLRKEQEEKELLLSEQRRKGIEECQTITQSSPAPQHVPENDYVVIKQAEAVESAPPEDLYSEDATYEEKRKSVGVRPLDVNKFLRSTSQDQQERAKRKQEFERERQRIEQQEMEQQREEELRRRHRTQDDRKATAEARDGPPLARKGSANFVVEASKYPGGNGPPLTRKESANFVVESSKHPGGQPASENSQTEKQLDSGTMNGLQEQQKDVRKCGKLNLGIWADIDHSAKDRKQKTSRGNSVDETKTVVQEMPSPKLVDTRYSKSHDHARHNSEPEEPVDNTPGEKPACGKLDPSRFITFQHEPQRECSSVSSLRRTKSEKHIGKGDRAPAEPRTLSQDDSGVQIRNKERPVMQKSRPKSVAGIETRGWDTSGQSAPVQKKLVLIGLEEDQSEHKAGVQANGITGSPEGQVRPVQKLDTSVWENRTSKRN